jgi:hypothetical protein
MKIIEDHIVFIKIFSCSKLKNCFLSSLSKSNYQTFKQFKHLFVWMVWNWVDLIPSFKALEKKNVQQIQKWSLKFFSCKGFHNFGAFCLDVLKPWSSKIYREALRGRNFSWPLLTLLVQFSSKMMFSYSKKSFQSLGSKYSLRTDLEVSRYFLFYRC